MGCFAQRCGAGGLSCYWLKTDDPGFEYDLRMCPTRVPLIWEYGDQLYLVPFEVIKNARRLLRDRQAHADVYNDQQQAETPVIMLSQAVSLNIHGSYLTKLTEQDLE